MTSLRLLTITEAADELGRSRDFIRRLIAGGDIPARRIGRRWMIAERALEEWINQGMPDPAPVDGIYQIPEKITVGQPRRRDVA